MLAPSPAPDVTARTPPLLPGGARLTGHLLQMAEDPLALLTRAHQVCGDAAALRFPTQPALALFHPDHVQHVLVGNAANYAKRTRGYRTLRLVLGDGLVTSEGELWRRQRRIAQPAFHKDRIAGFAATMARAAADQAEAWTTAHGAVDVAAAMYRLTLRIAGETLFGLDISRDTDAVGTALATVLERFRALTTMPLPWPELWPLPSNVGFHRARATLNRVVFDIIGERRRAGADVPDLLGMFMAARDEETGEGMNDRQLRDEVLTMLLAGHETTANALAWTLHLLAGHPEVGRRLEAEVDAQLGDRLPGFEDLRALPYTQQVIRESMRLYPPIWALARRALADDVVGGWRVRAGTFVFVSAWVMHRDPRFWDEPEAFRPERFAPDREPPSRYVYIPFSQGQRKCIGDRFAEMEATLVLAVLARRFRFLPVAGHPVVPEPSITLRPRHGIALLLERRA